MQYVVGTGRCGTATIAQQLGGVHEPRPSIVKEAFDYYMGNRQFIGELAKKLRIRAAMDTPVISDNRQSYVIPLIREIDPDAEFIVLIREPRACIASMLHRGAYQRPKWYWDIYRPRPCTGFPANWTPVMKVGWLWRETYRVILADVGTTRFRAIFTSELGDKVANASKSRPELELTKREKNFLAERVLPAWDDIRGIVESQRATP